MIPRATYRFQFDAGFTFADAEAVVPYLAQLGVSHIYASPICAARQGSSHGYDVVDPTRVSPVLGRETGLKSLAASLRAHGMGMVIDIVPNHMAASPENPWWADVLRYGATSEYAHFFEIDWSRHDGRVLLPVLGSPLREVLNTGAIRIIQVNGASALSLYDEQVYPLDPSTAPSPDDADRFNEDDAVGRGLLESLVKAQHYRLAWWRRGHDELNWRRFFSISELAGICIEDASVFDAVHDLPLRLYREGIVDGLRIDHVDGLSNPTEYLNKLRKRLDELDKERDGRAWLVVEKILGPEEVLPSEWPVDGTTGYDFMDEVSLLLHDEAGEAPLAHHWSNLSERSPHFREEERRARREMLEWEFTSQLESCVDAVYSVASRAPETMRYTRAAWRRSVKALLQLFPVYRTYGTGARAPDRDQSVRQQVSAQLREVSAPGEEVLAQTMLDWLGGNSLAADHSADFVRQFQQLSAPIAAKAVEDTAFYRYGRLLSRNDVGFDPGRFSMTVRQFHKRQAARAAAWPRSMLATATHDHKRGEDVRARLAAISRMAPEWIAVSDDWRRQLGDAGRGIDPGDIYMLLQTLLGAWPYNVGPDDAERLEHYAERLKGWQVKAMREAKLRSSWVEPDSPYETQAKLLIDWLLLSEEAASLRTSFCQFIDRLAIQARMNSLAQTFLRCSCPGVPDLYQGAELEDLSLVDPDNRRRVDFAKLQRLLSAGSNEKQLLIKQMLSLRSRFAHTFSGPYVPAHVNRADGKRVIAFWRGEGEDRLLFAAALSGDLEDLEDITLGVGGGKRKSFGRLLTSSNRLIDVDAPLGVWNSGAL